MKKFLLILAPIVLVLIVVVILLSTIDFTFPERDHGDCISRGTEIHSILIGKVFIPMNVEVCKQYQYPNGDGPNSK